MTYCRECGQDMAGEYCTYCDLDCLMQVRRWRTIKLRVIPWMRRVWVRWSRHPWSERIVRVGSVTHRMQGEARTLKPR